jgi:hypothetical protein
MDIASLHLWSAGYDLPAAPKPDPQPEPKRRGKKAAKAKRAKP